MVEPKWRRNVSSSYSLQEAIMFKGGLLWLIGIPLPIILGLWLFGYLS